MTFVGLSLHKPGHHYRKLVAKKNVRGVSTILGLEAVQTFNFPNKYNP